MVDFAELWPLYLRGDGNNDLFGMCWTMTDEELTRITSKSMDIYYSVAVIQSVTRLVNRVGREELRVVFASLMYVCGHLMSAKKKKSLPFKCAIIACSRS